MDSNYHLSPNDGDAFDGDAIDGHPIDGEDFRRLGIRAHEWRPSVIRRAASRSARGLARRLLRQQSPKAVQQLTQVSLSTYRLLDPRRRDDAHARAHIGRILPQTLSSAEGVLFQAAVLSDSGEARANRNTGRSANVGDAPDAFGESHRGQPSVGSTLVQPPPIARGQTGGIAEPSLAAVQWRSSLQQDDILQAGLRWRRWNRVARRFGIAGILVASTMVGVAMGLGAGDDAPPAITAKNVIPADKTPTVPATIDSVVDWVGPRTMPVPNPVELAESERRFADCYVDPQETGTINQMEQAIVIAETAFEDPDPVTRYVASLHATHWSWVVEPLDATCDRLEGFAHAYDLDLAEVVTQSYVSAIRCAREPEVAELVLGALPSVIDFLERSGQHRDSLVVLDQASVAVRSADGSLGRFGDDFDAQIQQYAKQAERNRELADWIAQRFPVDDSVPQGIDPLMVDAVGRYLTGVVERWDEGLAWSAASGDPVIAQAAQFEREWKRTGEGSPVDVAGRWEAVAKRVGGKQHRLAIYRHVAELLENGAEAVPESDENGSIDDEGESSGTPGDKEQPAIEEPVQRVEIARRIESNRRLMRSLAVPTIFRSR